MVKTKHINSSEIIRTHNDIKKIKLNYATDTYIDDNQIRDLLKKTNSVIEKNINNLELDISQTYREQKVAPKCGRHKKIFSFAYYTTICCSNQYQIYRTNTF